MSCELNIEQLVEAVDGRVLSQVHSYFKGVGTDTRKNLEGQLFVSLQGDNFDGHDYLEKAVENGARVLLVHDDGKITDEIKEKATIVWVPDTLKGLQLLANYWRKTLGVKVFAITGSNGKTTTKEFLASIMSTKFNVFASPASFNNHWGVPMSLLSVEPTHNFAIIEMGMNNKGELESLCKIAEPNVTVVTMVGSSHIGHFGTVEKVAEAKKEIYSASPDSQKVFNLDNEYTRSMYEEFAAKENKEKFVTFSSYDSSSNVNLRASSMGLEGLSVQGVINGVPGTAQLNVFGRHNVTNLMVASCLALISGMTGEEIWSAMSECKTTWGRNQLGHLANGTQVLFDGYNANPDSMSVLIKNLFEIPTKGKKVVILGEMLELGDSAGESHRLLGEMSGNTDIDVLWFVGEHQKDFEDGVKASIFQKTYFLSGTYEQTLANKIGSMLNKEDIVVIKGSRGMKLEQVLDAWGPVTFK